MSAFLRALVLARGCHETLALAGILALTIVLRAFAGALSFAGISTDAFHAGGLSLCPARRRRVLGERRASDKQRADSRGENRTFGSFVHCFPPFSAKRNDSLATDLGPSRLIAALTVTASVRLFPSFTEKLHHQVVAEPNQQEIRASLGLKRCT